MYSNQQLSHGGGQELILQPQKLAFDSELHLQKEFNSFEYTTHQQNRLKDLLHYQLTFEPNIFQMPNRINYKANKVDLIAEDFLPSVKMDTKVIKKIQSLLKDDLNKQFFLNGSSFESSSHDLVHQTFYLDKVSFDFEDSFEKSFYGRQEYSVTCFCIGDTSRPIRPSKIIQEQLKEAIKGISSFQGIDESDVQEYQYRRTDLLYLNHFRIFLFFETSSSQKDQYKIHRYLYYPRINFSAQLISQPFRLVSTPITAFLTQKSKNSNLTQKDINSRRNLVKYGFLSLDRSQRMIPLNASDNYCVQIPLVGIWTYGIEFSEDDQCEHSGKRFVWSLLAEFVKNKTIAQRFTYNEETKSFILAVFNLDRSAKYYEMMITENLDEDGVCEQIMHNLNESSCSSITRQWCMIKNYSMSSSDQCYQQLQMNYSNHSDIASKLSLEYPFRYSPKMIVNYFDDDEFFKNIKQQSMKESQVIKQNQINQNSQERSVVNKQTIKKNPVKQESQHSQKQSQQQSQQQLQRTVTNNNNKSNSEYEVIENQTQTQNIMHQQNKIGGIKSQILELQKQDEYFIESQKSMQSASFANNQTFSQNLHLNQNNNNNNNNINNNNINNNNNNNINNINNNTEGKCTDGVISPDATKIIQQQQEQINKMSQQIQELQEALKSFQNNSQNQVYANQSQYSNPMSSQSQSQIIQNPPPLVFAQNRGQNNHPMLKNYGPHPHPQYYYDQYHYYSHPMTAHQFPPPPPPHHPPHAYPSIQDHPYNMYHRGNYYMHESFVSGDGKSIRGGALNSFPVDAISDIQSIKKEDDAYSEVSQHLAFNNFHNQIKNVNNNNNIMQPPSQEEQLSFAHNSNNNMFQNTLTQRSVEQQQNMQNQLQKINQSGQSAQSLQIVQQNSFQSINNHSMQEQSINLNNPDRKHFREDSLNNQIIQSNNTQHPQENIFQHRESSDQINDQKSVQGGRKGVIQYEQQQQYQNEQFDINRKGSYESQQDKFPKYSPHLYYADEQKSENTKQINQEIMVSARPSIDQSSIDTFNYQMGNNVDSLQQKQIKLGSLTNEQNQNLLSQKELKKNKSITEVNNEKYAINSSLLEENQRQIKFAMENIMTNIESEETFTIDAKANYKMNLDFLNSVRKPDDGNGNKNMGNNKENKNSLNTVGNNKSKLSAHNGLSPSAQRSSSSNKDTKTKIPTIKYETYCDSDSSDDEVKKIEKKYLHCI